MPIYQEIWAGPGRNYKKLSNGQPLLTDKWYATIHNTSNDASASGEAIYAKIRPDGVGAHYFADSTQVLQSTDTDRCVGHVGSTQGNTRGISYEITGFNGWTRAQWMANVAWNKLAAVIARDCQHFGIPVRLLTIEQMRAYNSGLKGFVTHDMCRQAWGGTDHTDPGPNFPMDHLMALVRTHLGLGGDDEMQFIAQLAGSQACWLTNGMKCRPIQSFATMQWYMAQFGLKLHVFGSETEFGDKAGEKDFAGPDPITLNAEQMAAIAAAAAKGAEAGVVNSVDEIADAVVAEIAS